MNEHYELQIAKYMYKYHKNILPLGLANVLHIKTETRHKYNLRVRQNLSVRNKSCQQVGPMIWTQVPEDIKSAQTLKTFIRKYKYKLLQNYK